MDMTEEIAMENSQRRILFSMFESRDFAKFEGVWHMTPLGEKCRLRYEVEVCRCFFCTGPSEREGGDDEAGRELTTEFVCVRR